MLYQKSHNTIQIIFLFALDAPGVWEGGVYTPYPYIIRVERLFLIDGHSAQVKHISNKQEKKYNTTYK